MFFFSLLINQPLKAQEKPVDSFEYYSTKYDKSEYRLKALKYFFSHKDKVSLVRKIDALIMVAQIQNKLGVVSDSESSAIEALKLVEKLRNRDTISRKKLSIYNHLGKMYREHEDYNKALSNYNIAITLTDSLKYLTTIWNNIGHVYFHKDDYKTAIPYYKKSYDSVLKLNDKEQEARILDNIGFAQFKINHPDALNNLKTALKIRKEEKIYGGIITSCLHLGEFYKEKKQTNIANDYANKAYAIANLTNNDVARLAVLKLKMSLKKDADYDTFIKTKDRLDKQNKASSNNYAQLKYDNDKEKTKRLEVEQKYELSKKDSEKTRIIYISVFAFLILSSIYSYFILKSKHKKKTLQAVYKTESHISKKVHDEVANDVFQVMNTLQNNANINEKVIDNLEAIYIKTRNISKEHSVLDYEGDFKETLNDLLVSYNSHAVRVIIKDIDKVNWEVVSKIKKETIYKVLQEFMVNMKKHSQAEFVALTFKIIRKKIIITYSDDGIGTDLKKNTGLQNVENRIRTINGTINFESEINKGFKSKITV